MTTVRALINEATAQLQQAGCVSPQIDAELLLAHVLKVERSDLINFENIADSQSAQFQKLVTSRANRIPLQHLTGVAYFRYLTLQVGQGVFIPRPETELLVQSGLDVLAQIAGPKLVVDLCAGSGAVALSLALESADTTVHAVELSKDAFDWLEKNVAAYTDQLSRMNSTIITYNDDATSRDLLAKLTGTVDVVLSNPPYIPDEMIPREPEVREYDPPLALFGGADGLQVARKVALVASDLLRPSGFFAFEHADVQKESSVALLTEMQNNGQPLWTDVVDHDDYNELPRYVTAKRTSFSSVGAQ